MVEAKTQLLWLETTNKTKKKLGRNKGIPKPQLGFSLDQYLKTQLGFSLDQQA
jgi:hypothetical protein